MYSEGNPAVIAQARRRRVRALAEWENMEQKNTEYKNIEQNKKTGYALYDFMTRDLGLSGVALRVYALIYSFTAAGGNCHGSLDYIAERTQASRMSVCRALNLLVTRGYVTKVKSAPNRPNSYTANVDSHSQNVTVTDEAQYQNVTATVSKCYSDSIKMLPNNKDNNKEDNKDNYLPTNNCYRDELRPIEIGNGTVRLTLHQYVSLLRAIGVLPAIDYIRKLDRQITAHPERTYPNHYKTIVTWAREDYRIDARAEKILES